MTTTSRVESFNGIINGLADVLADESWASRRSCGDLARSLQTNHIVKAGERAREDATILLWAEVNRLHRLGQIPGIRKEWIVAGGWKICWDRGERYDDARSCIRALYAVTDRLPRTRRCGSCGYTTDDTADATCSQRTEGRACRGYLLEIYRPQAHALGMANLAARWAAGNFRIPADGVVDRWLVKDGFPSALNPGVVQCDRQEAAGGPGPDRSWHREVASSPVGARSILRPCDRAPAATEGAYGAGEQG